jgi:hypothetical protein
MYRIDFARLHSNFNREARKVDAFGQQALLWHLAVETKAFRKVLTENGINAAALIQGLKVEYEQRLVPVQVQKGNTSIASWTEKTISGIYGRLASRGSSRYADVHDILATFASTSNLFQPSVLHNAFLIEGLNKILRPVGSTDNPESLFNLDLAKN